MTQSQLIILKNVGKMGARGPRPICTGWKKSINNMMNTALDKWGLLQYYTRVHYKLHSSEGILDIVKRGGGGLADLRKFQEGIKQG